MLENNFIPGIRNSKLSSVFTVLWGCLIAVLCLMPADDFPKAEGFPNLDKIVHFTLYFILSLSVFSTFKLLKTKIKPFTVIISCFSFGFLIEILQAILPFNRSFSVFDLLANLIGLISGWLVFQSVISNRLA